MSIDNSEQIFEVESLELLEYMEQALLKLESTPDDADQINSIFRAAHTIKGSAGIFGFQTVVEFTHLVESVLDAVRTNTIEVNKELLSLLLVCRDIMERLVLSAINETEEQDDEFNQKTTDTSSKLQVYLDAIETSPQEQSAAPVSKDEPSPVDFSMIPTACWRISVKFGKDVLRNGMDPLSFIHYLGTLGTVSNVIVNWDGLPTIETMDPESCYISYSLDIESDADQQTLEKAFEFIVDDCELAIHSLSDDATAEALPEPTEIIASPSLAPEPSSTEKTPELDIKPEDKSVFETNPPSLAVSKPVKKSVQAKASAKSKEQASIDETIRVNAAKLGELINLVGELVISSANITLLGERTRDSELIESMENMGRLVENIRDKGLGLRMVPIGDTFNRYIRVVRDMSSALHKDIKLEISGAERELDKTIVEKIRDPLMHLVRNAVDHGVETPEQRQLANKPPQANLRLNAYHDSGSIVIEIEDDGAGLSTDRILAKAQETGLVSPEQELSDHEIHRLIFAPGFSTAAEITDISGRGVGMDVVMKNIVELRGTIDVESWPGKGSRFSIRLPLTLAIIDGFLVRVGQSSYAIPLDMVDECIEHRTDKNNPGDDNYVNLRGKVLSFIHLGALFNESHSQNERQDIVVVKSGNQKVGLVVDELLGEYQTVIKPLGKVFMNLNGISGATILGNGEVAPIIDVPSLIKRAENIVPGQINQILQANQPTEMIESVMH